ncbi:probable serine/threonine-protein kinase DDB_G0268642 isoform X1 [Gordionus sp. m RMFG-2023]|uniref:probable serine/threonine-protein kinase DDB_G0268642 isoform X1 n=1 Tax=Gordionus sp. m RMFG-2023 TaxID=3053472 RepID=UPI0031FC2EAE
MDDSTYAIKKIKLKWMDLLSTCYHKYSVGYIDNKIASILREAKVLSKLCHPNVIKYYNSWVQSDFYLDESGRYDNSTFPSNGPNYFLKSLLYIQTRYYPLTLRQILLNPDANTNFDSKLKLRLWRDILNGLQYIHDTCLTIHRDIKPENIFVDCHQCNNDKANYTAVIGDFGLATSYKPIIPPYKNLNFNHENIESHKREGIIHFDNNVKIDSGRRLFTTNIGTSLYSAPEQNNSSTNGNYDFKVDIYSAGIILYELLKDFNTESERIKSLMNIKNLDNFDVSLKENYSIYEKLVLKCIDINPSNRPRAKNLLHYLEIFAI